LLTELITVVLPIKASLDNIEAGCIAQNYVNNSRTKHIDVKYHMVRDWIAKKIFELFYIESNKNLADIFTKALAAPAHRGLAHRLLGGHPLPYLVIRQGYVKGICTERTTFLGKTDFLGCTCSKKILRSTGYAKY
jgi:hypothetical protein